MNKQLLKREILFTSLYRAADALSVLICGLIAYLIKFGDLFITNRYLFFLIVLIFLTVNIFSALSVYRGWRGKSLIKEFARLSIAWISVILLVTSLTFITKTGPAFSRDWAALTFAISFLSLLSYRVLLRKLISHLQESGYNQKRVIIIGSGDLGQRACKAMQKETWAGLIPIAFFDDDIKKTHIDNIPVKGEILDAAKFIESKRTTNPVDQAWIALPLSAQKKIENLQLSLQNTATKVFFIPDLYGFNLASYDVDEIVGLPVMNMSAPPLKGWSSTIKRIEDILIAFFSLILLSPIFALVSLLIKIDSPGPIFFKQHRYGQNGKEILVWKFRSMTVTEDGSNIKQASRSDARVTKIGAFLRKSSIDELPQLINVLFGSMSLVGPRPHAVAHNEYYREKVQGYMIRHQMRPGITGWAQVNGSRGETEDIKDMEERIRLDLDYIQNWSIFLDLQIILMTFKTVLNTKNTY